MTDPTDAEALAAYEKVRAWSGEPTDPVQDRIRVGHALLRLRQEAVFADHERGCAETLLAEARARLAALEPVVEAAKALKRQCNLPVEDYRRLGGRFGDNVAGELVCDVLAAVDALRAGEQP